jgi:nicotinate-nucleotide adenylyltransferase
MALTESPLRDSALHPLERLGILGGTFDPIHIGHLVIAEEVRVRLNLSQVWFVPARVSPLKLDHTASSAADRLEMVRLATADNPFFRISRSDLDREGPSFTVDTLRSIAAQVGPQVPLFYIMGMDSLDTLARWREPQEIIRLARIVVVNRPGVTVDWEALERAIPGLRTATEVIDSIYLGISSTEIRARVRQSWPIRYLVPPTVEAFILQHKLYRAADAGRGAWSDSAHRTGAP